MMAEKKTQAERLAPRPDVAKKMADAKEGKTEGKDAAPKEKKVRRSSFEVLYPKTAPMKCLVEENPKKAGSKSAARFEHYFKAKTVGEFLELGGTYGDIAFDIARKRIEIGPAPAAPAEPAAAAA